jgi:TolB-like protein/formylglycine-generating enzyme required for sulfatase activity
MSLLTELIKRKVIRVAATYAAIAWLLIEVSATIGPALNLPEWTVTFTTVLLMLGFPVALMLAWTFDVVRARSAASSAPGGIAVLPFANMTGEAEPEHFADGIVEDLLTRLQAKDGISVVSRQSSFAYKHHSVDARTIARELGCRYVMEGSVRKVGDRVRLTAQLIDALTDRHVWAERYDRRLEDAFQLQDEICDKVMAAIGSWVEKESTVTATIASRAGSTARLRSVLSGRWTIAALLALVAMAGLLTWTLHSQREERWAREEALPRLQGLIAKDDYAGAFDLARQILRVTPNDPVLLALRPSYSAEVNLNTAPEGAMVFFRPYTSTEKDWQLIGESPLVNVAIPIGVGLWRIEKEGRDTGLLAMRNPGIQLGNELDQDQREVAKEIDFTIPLADAATSPDGMVLVPAIRIPIRPVEDDFVEVPAFFMDRFEVSNHEFKEFIYASGYTEAAYWQGLPFDSASGGWQPAVRQFIDLTGQPGPSTWQAGTYGDGTADYPVTGVSWFEAAAYCRYRGKELPTAYHWHRAANSALEFWESLVSVIVHSSNFSGRGLEPVGRLGSLGPFGTYDMAGNAREWLWTQGTVGRLIAGGAFNDRPYQYNTLEEAPPFDRSAVNGIRCMRTMQGGLASEELRKPVSITTFDYAALEPVNDAAYSILAQQLDYRSVPFTPHVEEGNSSNPAWTRHRIELPTGYDTGTFAIQLFLPTDHAPPYQVVFYMPDGGVFVAPVTTDGFDPSGGSIPLDFLLKSGRALAVVAFDGTFERQWSDERSQSMTYDEQFRTSLRHWRQELGRTIDHFATRKDLDAGKLGWFGVSSGAADMVPLLAVEKRIGAAVLYSGGIVLYDGLPMSEQPFNYNPRVTQPVLMLNGRWDIIFPLPSQQRMLELLLGTTGEEVEDSTSLP